MISRNKRLHRKHDNLISKCLASKFDIMMEPVKKTRGKKFHLIVLTHKGKKYYSSKVIENKDVTHVETACRLLRLRVVIK